MSAGDFQFYASKQDKQKLLNLPIVLVALPFYQISVPATREMAQRAIKNASKINGGPAKCGTFTITSGWSGQFGADKGFTTVSVVSSKKQIVYPSYTDKQLAGGKVVKPDQKYSPASLP